MSKIKKLIDESLQPTQVLVLGFLSLIIIGTFLLSLPIASHTGATPVIDAFFTATSAVCVTGLVVVNSAAHWTVFGKVVIMILIQIGGLGFMTIATTIFIIMGKKIGLKDRLVIQEALNQNELSGMVRLTKHIIIGTFIIEAVGALLLSLRFVPRYGWKGIFYGVFHSVSAFCNAGFDILGNNSLMNYLSDPIVNITIMLLIILGGLGFSVWVDTVKVAKQKREKHWKIGVFWSRLSLHSKLVYVSTASLILFGFIFFMATESWNPNTLGNVGFGTKIWGALFQSVTTRTAGFNTMDLAGMTDASKFVSILLMFIGGSPAGTAGGVKTITVVVVLISVISTIKGKDDATAYGRRIPSSTIKKALAVIVISSMVVLIITLLMTFTESGRFLDMLFESVSAFATVGLTLGQTGKLTLFGKIIIAITMFIGRLGPLTMAVAISISGGNGAGKVKLPDGKVMVG